MDEFIHLEGYNKIKIFLSKRNFHQCNVIILNHIIHTDNNQLYYQNKSIVERFPKIENYKNINMWYQPRNILLDLTKIIIKRNLTDFYLEVLILSTMQIILAMVLEKNSVY